MRKDLLYSLCCLTFTIMIGGAVYEHLTVVPKWAAAPPASLSMFQGQYGLKPELFWMIIHPVNLVLFIASLITHWRTQRRKNLGAVVLSYMAVLIITSIYFVPELISITSTPMSSAIDPELVSRAKLWENLSLVRLASLLVLAMVLFMGLTKSSESRASSNLMQRAALA